MKLLSCNKANFDESGSQLELPIQVESWVIDAKLKASSEIAFFGPGYWAYRAPAKEK